MRTGPEKGDLTLALAQLHPVTLNRPFHFKPQMAVMAFSSVLLGSWWFLKAVIGVSFSVSQSVRKIFLKYLLWDSITYSIMNKELQGKILMWQWNYTPNLFFLETCVYVCVWVCVCACVGICVWFTSQDWYLAEYILEKAGLVRFTAMTMSLGNTNFLVWTKGS